MSRLLPISLTGIAATAALALFIPQGWAQRDVALLEPDEAQAELTRATREGQRAQARAARLAREAETVTEAADRSAREAAALAARIQASEADISAARAQYSLAQTDRQALSRRLAERQEPVLRLTGALQTTARRPLALSALQPGSLKELVYVRAVLASAVPEIRKRTSALRGELEEQRRIEARAADALANLTQSEQQLRSRRSELAAIEARQRVASQEARGAAVREGERALALAEEARDLDGLIGELGKAAQLRRQLAALPGPLMRPTNIAAGVEQDPEIPVASISAGSPPANFQLPVQGRTIAGFGELRESGLRATGFSLVPAGGAQVVAPSAGRIAFAGPYRGFGRIVIIDHPGGWTSLVTGLARVDPEVGDEVIGGAPLGVAESREPSVTIELRRDGEPVNPLNYLG